jgi:RNA polymerase subunit RPABC4/transcription elongation factor Spt4
MEWTVPMTVPSRMPRYTISNDGVGPYAIFYCDRDNREYRSTPAVAQTVKDTVKRGMLGGLLRNVPVVGWAAANQVENSQYRSNMSKEELDSAFGTVVQYFRECPTCHQIVCVPDFDEVTGFCNDDSPRAAEVQAAKAQQAGAMVQGFASAFGLGGAMQQGIANAQAQQAAAAPGSAQPAGGPPAGVAAAMTAAAMNAAMSMTPCVSCGTPLAPGTKFCANCGTPVAQAKACAKCGTALAAGAKFCPNCGTPSA